MCVRVQLETNMTSLALDSLARQLNSTARSLQQPQFQREARDLLQAAADLERLNRRVLAPMLDDAALLNVSGPTAPTGTPCPAALRGSSLVMLPIKIEYGSIIISRCRHRTLSNVIFHY